MALLDFKNWECVSQDGKTCLLKHKDGHTMTVAMQSLPKLQQAAIKKMAKGGKVRKNYEDGGETSNDSSDNNPIEQALNKQQSDYSAAMKPTSPVNININAQPQPTPAQPVQDRTAELQAMQQRRQNAISGGQAAQVPIRQPAGIEDTNPSDPRIPNLPIDTRAPLPVRQNPIQGQAQTAVNQQALSIQQQQAIDEQKARQQAVNEQNYLDQRNDLAQTDRDNLTDMQTHTNQFARYVAENPIRPNAYLQDKSVGSKMGIALGIVLGGAGAGGGGQNQALGFLNNQIDRDVKAQQQNVENHRTIYEAYHQLYGDTIVAQNLAKASLNDVLVHQANQQAAALGTQQAAANANALQAQKSIENLQLLGVSAQRQSAIDRGAIPAQTYEMAPQGQGVPPTHRPQSSSRLEDIGTPLAPGELTPEERQAIRINPRTGMPMPISHGAPGNEKLVDLVSDLNQKPIEPILHPGSDSIYQGLMYTPKAKEQMGEISKQYNGAVQADKSLNQLGTTFGNLVGESQAGGLSGRFHRSVNPHAIAGAGAVVGTGIGAFLSGGPGAIPGATIGGTLGEGVGQTFKMATDTDINRRFEANKSILLGIVSSALKGTNIGANQIQEVVDANTPEYGDNPKTLLLKKQNIEDFVKNHTDTSLLKVWHLLNEK